MDKYQQADHDWQECLWKVGRRETEEFEAKSILYTNNLIECNCRRNLMCWIYTALVMYKGVTRIERLDKDVKEKMWLTVKDLCAGRVNDKLKMVEIAKVFYVIEYFLNEQNNPND
jgi:hypothetical protein